MRSKFDRLLSARRRGDLLKALAREAAWFRPEEPITACRAPQDNRFLEQALAAPDTCLITGDQDLLVLHPFLTIPIPPPHKPGFSQPTDASPPSQTM